MEIQSSIIPVPAVQGSMLRNPKTVYAMGDHMYCLATDGKLWKCHRRQKGSEGYMICYEMTDKMSNYAAIMVQLAKEDSIHVTTQFMDDDQWGPRQDLELIPHRVRNAIVNYLIENNSCVKSEGDARAYMTTMSKRDLLEAFLVWNGIMGFTDTIIDAVNGIDNAKLGFKQK